MEDDSVGKEGDHRAPATSISRPRRPSLTIPLYHRILSTAVVALVVIELQIETRPVDSPKIHRGRHSDGSVKMELSDFEFYTTLQDAPSDKLMLPMKFAELLKSREPRGLKLREADDPSSSPWDVDVLFNAAGCIYLGRGWKQFA
ncbi:hypothetical protein QYE76_067325 [Lolium multiflorum]|uniref:TF-B3 domain-containing protein n=1 Tax=Lolium multiflorum TaxID=4521 RepID=A0AAD8WBK1_LOLMU|nr:hypothetical protein QYE76_067325 [Lolium multiflorum]